MIDFSTDFNDDLERTQRLPALTAQMQLDEALQRERAARMEIVELMRQNLRQAKEAEHLRARQIGTRLTQTIERHVLTEEKLFEVCGALKDTLSMVLKECRTRRLALNCGGAARRAFDSSCHKLEEILSAPGFSASTIREADVEQEVPLAKACQSADLALRSISVIPSKRSASAGESRSANP
jgi:hypothetical protein